MKTIFLGTAVPTIIVKTMVSTMVAGVMVPITVVPVTLVRTVQASNNLGLPVRPPTRPPACLPVPVCLLKGFVHSTNVYK